MSDFDLVRFIIAISIGIVIFAFSYYQINKGKREYSAKFIVRCGIFAAFSIILYMIPIFNISLPFFPFFLKIHFDEIPVFIAGFAYGPMSAVFILLVKTVVKLPLSFSGGTMGVGELADFLYSLAFILPAAIYYRKHRSLKGAIISFVIGTIVQLFVSTFVTTFVMLKFYIFVMGWSEGAILGICQAVNPSVTNLTWPFLFFISLPFNALKDILVVILTMILYKRLHTLIDKIGKN